MMSAYETRPEAYRTCAKWLDSRPDEILMIAYHNFDLLVAHAEGYKSAFVCRPTEWGPAGPSDPVPNPAHDVIAQDFAELATRLSA